MQVLFFVTPLVTFPYTCRTNQPLDVCTRRLTDIGVCCTLKAEKNFTLEQKVSAPGHDMGASLWITADGWDYFFRSTAEDASSAGFLVAKLIYSENTNSKY